MNWIEEHVFPIRIRSTSNVKVKKEMFEMLEELGFENIVQKTKEKY